MQSHLPLKAVGLRLTVPGFVQIADEDRKISTLYDMLDYQDATNRDQKGLAFTVSADMTCRSPLGLSVTLTIPAPDYG